MVSYSDNREDVLLRRLFPGHDNGFFIDVGANHPVGGSVTKYFSERGWRGVNIEPIRRLHSLLVADRPRDVNLQVALSSAPGEMNFHEVSDDIALSTFDERQAEKYAEAGRPIVRYKVPVLTLAQVCHAHVRGEIDFVNIDVEGHEAEVLRGADFNTWRPRALVIESVRPWSSVPTHGQWEELVLQHNYVFAAFDGVNRIYVRSEDALLAKRLTTPVCILDRYVSHREVDLANRLREYEQSPILQRTAAVARWLRPYVRRRQPRNS
jgi:FkbM family methyltransferase